MKKKDFWTTVYVYTPSVVSRFRGWYEKKPEKLRGVPFGDRVMRRLALWLFAHKLTKKGGARGRRNGGRSSGGGGQNVGQKRSQPN